MSANPAEAYIREFGTQPPRKFATAVAKPIDRQMLFRTVSSAVERAISFAQTPGDFSPLLEMTVYATLQQPWKIALRH